MKTVFKVDTGGPNNLLGIYYALPDGRVAFTYGRESGRIKYRFDDGEGGRDVSDSEFQCWTPLPELDDFPDSTDPVLPYDFDLWFDIKRMSDLRVALHYSPEEKEIREMMEYYGISADPEEIVDDLLEEGE